MSACALADAAQAGEHVVPPVVVVAIGLVCVGHGYLLTDAGRRCRGRTGRDRGLPRRRGLCRRQRQATGLRCPGRKRARCHSSVWPKGAGTSTLTTSSGVPATKSALPVEVSRVAMVAAPATDAPVVQSTSSSPV